MCRVWASNRFRARSTKSESKRLWMRMAWVEFRMTYCIADRWSSYRRTFFGGGNNGRGEGWECGWSFWVDEYSLLIVLEREFVESSVLEWYIRFHSLLIKFGLEIYLVCFFLGSLLYGNLHFQCFRFSYSKLAWEKTKVWGVDFLTLNCRPQYQQSEEWRTIKQYRSISSRMRYSQDRLHHAPVSAVEPHSSLAGVSTESTPFAYSPPFTAPPSLTASPSFLAPQLFISGAVSPSSALGALQRTTVWPYSLQLLHWTLLQSLGFGQSRTKWPLGCQWL